MNRVQILQASIMVAVFSVTQLIKNKELHFIYNVMQCLLM